jgi:diguanylate cyclase (GGDEF)-like protein
VQLTGQKFFEEPMISLKKYLESQPDPIESGDAEERDLFSVAMDAYGSALLEMGNCSLDACPGLGDDLKRNLGDVKTELHAGISCKELADAEEGIREHLRGWGHDAAKHYQQKACEVKDLLLVMARTAESVSARDQRCAGQMSQVTERLSAIASLDDLTEIRASIEKSATELKSSIDRMTEEGKAVLNQLHEELTSYQTKLEEAEAIASRDALTGVSSRLYVEGQIEKRISAGSPLCAAIIDIDGFKKVNDDHGHLVGDEVLKQFAVELRSACRTTDLIGRWGGDEFILLFDCGLAEAEAQVARLRKWICGNYTVNGRTGDLKLRVDASIGLAAHTDGQGTKELIESADTAMYKEKAASPAKRSDLKRSARR